MACRKDHSTLGIRDGAIMALMVHVGLRRSEVVGLDDANYIKARGECESV